MDRREIDSLERDSWKIEWRKNRQLRYLVSKGLGVGVGGMES